MLNISQYLCLRFLHSYIRSKGRTEAVSQVTCTFGLLFKEKVLCVYLYHDWINVSAVYIVRKHLKGNSCKFRWPVIASLTYLSVLHSPYCCICKHFLGLIFIYFFLNWVSSCPWHPTFLCKALGCGVSTPIL